MSLHNILIHFLLGTIVILLQRSVEYTVLGVGQVVNVQGTEVPNNNVPVYVASIEPCATGLLAPGQVVFWPLDILAVYKPPNPPTHTTESSLQAHQDQNCQNVVSSIPCGSQEDRQLNYGLQVIQLGMMLMQLNDTEHEGDGDRSLINWKMLLLYFRCRPKGMKYAYEAMRFITCVKALYTEKTAHRILHGQFVNPKGGEGNNYANDLKMEHCIQDNKVSIRGMRANKTLNAVQRCSGSSYGQKEFCIQFDGQCNIPPESTRHTHACTTEDVKSMLAIVQQVQPFKYHAGRQLNSFPHISKSPLDKLDVALLHTWLTSHRRKLFAGTIEFAAEESEDEDEPNRDDVDHDESSEEDYNLDF